MADPSQIGALDAATAGTLGSYALIGVLIGALTCGSIGDYVGRRRIILVGIAWFSIGMFVTSLATSIFAFGALRLITGIGLGAILATAGATIAEFAPAGRRNFYNAVVYSGIPAGGVLAALLGMILLEPLGWRGLFMIGATPAKTGFGAVFSSQFRVGALLLGFMSFSGLLLTYGLNTWLPKIMEGYGYGKTYSLAFLLVLNSGAVIGGVVASKLADRRGPQFIVSTTFVIAAITLVLMTFHFPWPEWAPWVPRC